MANPIEFIARLWPDVSEKGQDDAETPRLEHLMHASGAAAHLAQRNVNRKSAAAR